jgi:hypothetical protein
MRLSTRSYNTPTSRDVLVLVHGLGSAATAWKPIIPALSEKFNVITADLPGHGESPMDPAQAMDPQSLAILVRDSVKANHGVDEFHLVGYRKNLINKIGQEMVDWIEANYRTPKKWSRTELNELIEKYK